MSLWLDILNLAASGDREEAHRLLNFDMPLALRYPEARARGDWQYQGPVAKAVRLFVATRPDAERGMVASRAEDLVDYITDLIVAQVRRTLALVELCCAAPDISLAEIAEGFTGWDGLKRGADDRRAWVAEHLRSMSEQGIPLPTNKAIAEAKEQVAEANYGYDERALVKEWQVSLSWKDFKEQHELDSSYLYLTDPDSEEESAANEGFDYGSITVARVVLNLEGPPAGETLLDLNRMGASLSVDLREMLEQLHAEKPTDGYHPIAWHNVWWNIISKYEGLSFMLETRAPLCDVDHVLATHIAENYTDVLKPNRLNIQRRRTRLNDSCVEIIDLVLLNWSHGSETSREMGMFK
ncbi:MAG TPA: hypothetical protein VGO91_09105 [Pyrinomonadaceae bacterium]|jgi:hypothetical protein|nr:hypothetical protein [Pyrinomonadaceae bacterium]